MPRYVILGLFAVVLAVPGSASASGFDPLDPSFADGPPRGTYIWLDQDDLVLEPDVQQHGAAHVLFLNRCQGGLTITGSNQNDSVNNQSTVGGGTFPEYSYGDASWNQVVAQTRQLFAPYNVLITDVDPSPASHDEAIVCGTPGVIGLPNGVGGVAPFSCGQINNAITFTFAGVYGGDVDEIVATIGQEAAHAWGLEHLLSCNDPMTYLSSPFGNEGACWPKSFQDKETQCGEYSVRNCDCGGGTQNSHQHILNMFGSAVPDTAAPVAALVAPADGAYFTAGDDFDIVAEVSDDGALTEVRLFNNGALQATSSGAPFGPWPAANIPEGTYELSIEAEDAAGNVTTSETVTIYVTADGMVPADESSGEGGAATLDPDSGGNGTNSGTGTGGVSDSNGGSNGDSDSAAGDDEGGLPPGFGEGNGTAEGCACTSDPRGGTPGGTLLLIGVLLGLTRRRVHQHRARR